MTLSQLALIYRFLHIRYVERSPREQSIVGSNPTQGSSFFLSLEKGVVLGGIEWFVLPLPCCLVEFHMHIGYGPPLLRGT